MEGTFFSSGVDTSKMPMACKQILTHAPVNNLMKTTGSLSLAHLLTHACTHTHKELDENRRGLIAKRKRIRRSWSG